MLDEESTENENERLGQVPTHCCLVELFSPLKNLYNLDFMDESKKPLRLMARTIEILVVQEQPGSYAGFNNTHQRGFKT
ncbi:MAG TPA: hypothetical protein ENG03_01045 [Thioploca sp.]|nr:hypothetical protein [Thioploca sp.]